MKRTEQRTVFVTYCDICGKEVKGTVTAWVVGTGDEKHACDSWNEEKQARCDQVMGDQIAAACASKSTKSD